MRILFVFFWIGVIGFFIINCFIVFVVLNEVGNVKVGCVLELYWWVFVEFVCNMFRMVLLYKFIFLNLNFNLGGVVFKGIEVFFEELEIFSLKVINKV